MKKVVQNILILFTIILLWFIFSLNSNPLFLPTPQSVLEDVITLTKNGMLLTGIWKSFYRITIATGISFILSMLFALLIYSNKIIDKIISPIVDAIRYVPITAFYPLLILWVGINEKMKITFLICATFVYFLPNTVLCLKEIDKRLIETGLTMGMTKFQILTQIVLPYSAPLIFKTLLLSCSIGWNYIVIAEMANAVGGLGYIINIGSARGRTDMVFMSLIIIVIINWIIDYFGNKLLNKLFKWKYLKNEEE